MNFEELARSCDDYNGAQLKAVCVEAGMLALRREAEQVRDFSFWLCCYFNEFVVGIETRRTIYLVSYEYAIAVPGALHVKRRAKYL